MAFPYGVVMLFAHLPWVWVGALLDMVGGGEYFTYLGFRLSLLVADFAVLLVLFRLLNGQQRHVLLFYWLSPIVLYINYWHGQTDIVPVAFLMLAFLYMKRLSPRNSGIALALAVAAKLSMLLAVPFLVIYLWRSKRLRTSFTPFLGSVGGVLAVAYGAYSFSPGFQQMVLGTPEAQKIFLLSLRLGEGLAIYLTPLVYLLLLYATWRLKRINLDLLLAMTGVSFFAVVLMTPAGVGWYLWMVPFLVAYQLGADRIASWQVALFTMLLIPFHVIFAEGATVVGLGLYAGDLARAFPAVFLPHLHSLYVTLIVASGLMLILRMYRHGVTSNDYYRISRQPLGIGISGDSGVGKDTLGTAIAGLFGEHSVASLCGDDYHRWERHTPMWRAVTHLNPQGNDLMRFTEDAVRLIEGRAVTCRRYDHATGRFTRPRQVEDNEVVIISGLHALYAPELREKLHVRIYLDPDEALRRYWKLKRDTGERNHPAEQVLQSMERRRPDGETYIRPQSEGANVIFSLFPAKGGALLDHTSDEQVPISLRVLLRRGTYYAELSRTLIGLCGAQLELDILEGGAVEMVIGGDVFARDIELAARKLLPHLDDLLALEPRWEGGVTGIMQLTTIMQVDHELKARPVP
jgi:uridine kinase